MEYFCHSIWEKNNRILNEDALCLLQVSKRGENYLLAVVCDGIGGLPEGENASTYVADSMRRELMKQLVSPKRRSMRRWRNLFLQQIYLCHQTLADYGREKRICLGTTITMLFLHENQGCFFQAGDSALFSGKDSVWKTVRGNSSVGLKRISSIHRTRNGALKQAIGAGKALEVEWKQMKIRKGSVFLLASDGFYQKNEKRFAKEGLLLAKPLRKKTDRKNAEEKNNRITKTVREETEKEMEICLARAYQNIVNAGESDNATAICIMCK